MNLEIHMLQNFAPSNLNRDDTNAPKDCDFGGHRRARISSQCIKRSVRTQFKHSAKNGTLDNGLALGHRTKRLQQLLVKGLVTGEREEDESSQIAHFVMDSQGFADSKKPELTNVLLFLGDNEVASLVHAVNEAWDELLPLAQTEKAEDGEGSQARKKAKKKKKAELPDSVKKAFKSLRDGPKAMDIALFGRMIAEMPELKVDAASQVAHAISTNKVSMEFDFYTAVDDIQQEQTDETGAGMMGTVEFNSSCFYRYANVDLEQLKLNLGEDEEIARKTIEAFLRAAVSAVPTGKQNSMAAQNPPSFILVVLRDAGMWSLANAFVNPIHASGDKSLIARSIEALDDYFGRLLKAYGDEGIQSAALLIEEAELMALSDAEVENLEGLATSTLSRVRFNGGEES